MAKGKWKSTLLGIQGLIGHVQAPNWDFLYVHSTVRDPKWNIGDRVVTPDGRVFRYANASATLNPDLLAQQVTGQHIAYRSVQAAAAVGDTSVNLTITAADGAAADGVIAVDELRGGYIVIFDNDGKAIQRGIIGNTVTAGAGTITIYLDGALTVALTVDDSAECIASPYLSVKASVGGDGYRGFIGLPLVIATVGQYCWLQTWGPCWVAPANGFGSANPGNTQYNLALVARYNGSVQLNDSDVTETEHSQPVGFILSRATAGTQGAPFMMLQISP